MSSLRSRLVSIATFILGVPHFGDNNSVAAACSDFTGEWMSDYKQFVNISQVNCTVFATNPQQMWSPSVGIVVGDTVSSAIGTGMRIGNKILWYYRPYGPLAVWNKVEAPPFDEGIAELRSMLQVAVETEQSVIQPYLTTLYSIKLGTNQNATSILHQVVIEEMLHMTSAANVLNAIGGHPIMNTKAFVPVYPMMLPFINISVSLAPFSPWQAFAFRRIEEATWGPDNQGLRSIGVYYFEMQMKLKLLVDKYGEEAVFSGDPSLQVNASSDRGSVTGVYNLADAVRNLAGVLNEGEGIHGSLHETNPYNGKKELSHYHRFNEVVHNRYYSPTDVDGKPPTGANMGLNWTAVYRFSPDPKAADYVGYPEIHQKMLQFNSCYTHLLSSLHDVFNGAPQNFMKTVMSMRVLSTLARDLVTMPAPDKPGLAVGTPWEWLDPHVRLDYPCPGLDNTIIT